MWRVACAVEGEGGGEGRKGQGKGADASDVWRDQTCCVKCKRSILEMTQSVDM